MFNPFNAILGMMSRDIGIDLGTANTLVLVRGKGVVINEPSVVAINKKTRKVLAIGAEAKRMVGRTPANIVAIRPLKDGVISDFDVTEQMLHYFIARVHDEFTLIPRPRVVVGIPSGVTEVERRAVHDATCSAGAREALLIEEPMAAAIGAGLPITEPSGSMIVDIGGGTTEVAVISLGGLVAIHSIRIAGDEMDQDIVNYVRQRHNLLIGERMAEEIKIKAGSAYNSADDRNILVRGREVLTGLPGEILLHSSEVREAIAGSIDIIVDAVTDTIEDTPPELVADMMARGITLAGGGALMPGLDRLLAEKTGIEVHVAEDPLQSVVRGTGLVLEDLDMLRKVLVDTQDSKGPRRR
ncbi:MAG TPA: rod shape-determining protein [Chloroflexota bacterium]|nr:rod shape-determining protein [Chloroflexota bacterium]